MQDYRGLVSLQVKHLLYESNNIIIIINLLVISSKVNASSKG